jgi:hypothetical protein
MADVRVIEDGVDSREDRGRPTKKWTLPVVGFLVGLGLGVLVVGPGTGPAVVPPPASVEPGDLGTPVEEAEDPPGVPGLAGAIPEFPDAMVAIGVTGGSTLDHMLWPQTGSPSTRPIVGGNRARFDATSQFIAVSTEVPGREGFLLSLGRFNSMRPVSADVTSYAWHDSKSGLLAYTVVADGGLELFNVHADTTPRMVTDGLAAGSQVSAWGDWGWAIQEPASKVVLLTPGGEFKDSESGVVYDSHDSGWMFVVDDDLPKLVSGGGGVRSFDDELGVGTVVSAAFSPDGEKVVVGATGGVVVIAPGRGVLTELKGGVPAWLAWSSDSRFVIAAAASGAVVHDLDTGESYPILRDRPLLAAGVIALRSS